jgi:hypothetical protein
VTMQREKQKKACSSRAARKCWHPEHWVFGLLVGLMLLGFSAAPARAHVRPFLGVGLPVPVYTYAYPYASPYSYRHDTYYSPRRLYGGAPPVCGHWAWRHDAWGRRIRFWVPAHLR